MKSYWDNRYSQQGHKTVGNCALSVEDFELKTEEVRKKVFEFFVKYFVQKKVLDYGCGWGRLSVVLSLIASEVHGVDIAQWAIDEARKTLTHGHFNLFDGCNIPYPDSQFGGILTWTVLQHVPSWDIEKVCKEIDRVMEANGVLILYENCSIWIPNKSHIWFRSADAYKALFSNFSVEREEIVPNADDTEEDHVLMVMRKKG